MPPGLGHSASVNPSTVPVMRILDLPLGLRFRAIGWAADCSQMPAALAPEFQSRCDLENDSVTLWAATVGSSAVQIAVRVKYQITSRESTVAAASKVVN